MAAMKPPENWSPPSHTAIRSIGFSIWSQWVATQVARAPITPASTMRVPSR